MDSQGQGKVAFMQPEAADVGLVAEPSDGGRRHRVDRPIRGGGRRVGSVAAHDLIPGLFVGPPTGWFQTCHVARIRFRVVAARFGEWLESSGRRRLWVET
jgi:hypothetical protein